jgi:hypothetical protein
MSRIESIGLTRSQERPPTLNEAGMAIKERVVRPPFEPGGAILPAAS